MSIFKTKLSFGQIINMNLGFFGIQYSFALQQSAVNPIYDMLGAEPHQIPILNLAGPLTGLIIQPLIGTLSDKTWSPKWGRRKPYFFIGAIMCSLALFFFPFSSALWMAVGLLWILDIGNNTAMEPYRAFVADKLIPEQQGLGFQAQSFFTGFGQALANFSLFIFPLFIVGYTGRLPTWVFASFILGAILSVVSVWWSMKTTPEIPPTEEEIAEINNYNKGKPHPLIQLLSVMVIIAAVPLGIYYLLSGNIDSEILNLCLLPICLIWAILLFRIVQIQTKNLLIKQLASILAPFIEIVEAIKTMPKIMWGLALVYLFQWYALFCYWQNSGKAVSKNIYGWQVLKTSDNLKADYESYEKFEKEVKKYAKENKIKEKDIFKEGFTASSIYKEFRTKVNSGYLGQNADSIQYLINNRHKLEKGSILSGSINGWYTIVTFLVAFFLVFLARKISPKYVHFVCLVLSGLGFIWFSQLQATNLMYVAITGFGIGWASMMGIPYLMVVHDIPKEKYGVYMGIINMMIVIPMFIQTVSFGYIMKNMFNNDSTKAILFAGVLLLIAAICTLLLKTKPNAKQLA
jgi:maltose/moltooligosaccharide transporter